MRKLHNHLKVHRKKSSLSQKDISFLLGSRFDHSHVSKCESGLQDIHTNTLITYHLLLDVPIEQLIPHQRERIAKKILPQINKRIQRLQEEKPVPSTQNRIQFLKESLKRLTNSFS
ncbi:MAG: helix-turn-helix transcriptional regulator [Chitinophagales bacterium]